MVTKEQAQTAHKFHCGDCTRTVGPRGGVTVAQMVYRRNGRTQTWKTRPTHFSVPVKYGMYEYGYVDHTNASHFHTLGDCPLLADA